MNFSRADFPHLRSGVLILLCVLCAGGAAIVASDYVAARAQQDLHDTQRRHDAAHAQLAAAYADQQNIATYSAEYHALRRRNIIGNEQRLDWIEGLAKIRQQRRVLDFSYAIAPQQPYVLATLDGASAPLDGGNFDLKSSGMTMHFDLLHEQQLLDFFDALRSGINGRFILNHCQLTRTHADTGDEQHAAPLKAECTGVWLTLQHRNAT